MKDVIKSIVDNGEFYESQQYWATNIITCFAGYYSNFRYSCYGICIQHFCAVTDNNAVFLVTARQEARYVYQVQQRNVESIAEANKTRGFVGCVDIQAASHYFRLVCNDT